MPPPDQIDHVAEEKGQQKRADVGAVHVGVGHDDDCLLYTSEIEYTTLDATLVGAFHGWQNGTILTLANGQRWVVVDDDRYWAPSSGKPVHVRIVPGILGSFFMEIEKGGRPRVRFLGNAAAPQAPQ